MNTKFIEYFKRMYKSEERAKCYEAIALELYDREDRTGVILEFVEDLSEEDAKGVVVVENIKGKFYSYVNKNVKFIWDEDAIQFLAKYDKSLELSTALVHGTRINSVTLATALKKGMAKEDFDAEGVFGIIEDWKGLNN